MLYTEQANLQAVKEEETINSMMALAQEMKDIIAEAKSNNYSSYKRREAIEMLTTLGVVVTEEAIATVLKYL
jgi:hypothetical protein